MMNEQPYIPFSQRTGLRPMPPQLEFGKVSDELRRLFDYCVSQHLNHIRRSSLYIQKHWMAVTQDAHIRFFGDYFDTYNYEIVCGKIKDVFRISDMGEFFDLIEFFVRHPDCSNEFKRDLAKAFVDARAAYRIVDNQIIAISAAEQGVAVEKALLDAGKSGAVAARAHLIAAGAALRNADWAGSVRESIHAVEAMACELAPDKSKPTLGDALNRLENVHPALKKAFGVLYGYTSDEKGIRHALHSTDEANVDETDALFMLGACASFVSYLIARSAQHDVQ